MFKIYFSSNINFVKIITYSLKHKSLYQWSGPVWVLSADNESALIASGSLDKRCRVWSQKQCRAEPKGYKDSVLTIAFTIEFLITCSADKTPNSGNMNQRLSASKNLKDTQIASE